jgi:3-oxoacyl-[acyl-carrier protein] reductase
MGWEDICMRLPNKVALITGSGSGIGRASAVLFSQEGAKIAVVDIDEKSGQETVRLIRQQGRDAFAIRADVTKASDTERMVQETLNRYGRVDILFNNAGICNMPTPIEEVQEELFDKIMDVNVKGVFLGCKYGVPIMKKQGGGVIVNTASISGVRPRPGLSIYSASKGAVILLTKGLAIELAPHNIRVNCINPVATETPMMTSVHPGGIVEEKRKILLSTIPLGRINQPEDIARSALYLASDEASMVTGVCLDVDGGRSI